MDVQERKKAIIQAISQMEKQFGKGSIQRLGAQTAVSVNIVPSGSISLDFSSIH